MELTVITVGEEQMPSGEAERAEVVRLQGANGDKLDELLKNYFELNPANRYMGSFPYPNRNTGQPCVMWALSVESTFRRDAIVACLRAAILEAGLVDIAVLKADDDPARVHPSRWPAGMNIVAMGPSITDTLVGERRVQAALDLLTAWLSRA